MKILKGISCSGGIAAGKAFKIQKKRPYVVKRQLCDEELANEQKKLETALELTKLQINSIKEQTKKHLDKLEIFNAHLAILEDPELINELNEYIVSRKCCAASAVEDIFQKHMNILESMEDDYFRERASDIDDLGQRMLRNITGAVEESNCEIPQGHILIYEEITPTDMVTIIKSKAAGIISSRGGSMSHAAIMARSLRIPAVFGTGISAFEIRDYEEVILDGNEGLIIVSPDERQKRKYLMMSGQPNVISNMNKPIRVYRSDTLDGAHITIRANIDTPEDIPEALRNGAEGVGLYRSEFLFSNYEKLPDERIQEETYRSAAAKLSEKPLAIRTLDAGGDKQIPGLYITDEANPFMGWRSIRVLLDRKDIFKTQLRAILKAGANNDISIMYPMISCVSELRAANDILQQVKDELAGEGVCFCRSPRVGVMVEVPSAVLMIDTLLKEVDFVSIGTNDLCQFVLAADRSNPYISHLYQPLHPAVLKLIKIVAEAADKHGKPVSVCGEMAADPAAIIVLVGLGLKEFSMNAAAIPAVRETINKLTLDFARETANYVLGLSTAAEANDYANWALQQL